MSPKSRVPSPGSSARGSVGSGRAAGFTLIEVLVALVVTVAGLAIVAQGFTTAARASTVSQNATRAALLAQRVMTGLETGEITLGAGSSQSFDDEPDFAYETLAVPDPDGTELDVVTVTIKWREREQDRAYVLMRMMRDKTATTTSNP